MAHEFNNLLTVINGYSDILINQALPGSTVHQDASTILEAGQRAAELTHQLLAYSRRQTLLVSLFDLNELLAELVPTLRRLVNQHQLIDLVAIPAPAPIWVRADQEQINQVILQLAGNAQDVMPQGGQLRVQARQIELDAERAEALDLAPGRYGLIAVTDNGPGLSQQAREHLFEPFFHHQRGGRGHRPGPGHGLRHHAPEPRHP